MAAGSTSTIDIVLNAYDRGLRAGLSAARGELGAFRSSISSLESSVNSLKGAMVGLAGAFALYKAADFIKDSALLAARYETLGVVMNNVGKQAGYSQQQMAWFDQELQKNGIGMNESRVSLARMAQSHLELSKAVQLGRIAQDAATIAGINSSQAFEALIHGIQSAQVEVLRNIGINVNFETSYKKAAAAVGKTTADLSENEKMLIRQNAVLEAGTRIHGTYEAAMETAGKQLTSLTRYYDTFRIQLGEALGPATTILVKGATEALKEMAHELTREDVRASIEELATQLANAARAASEKLPSAIAQVASALKAIKSIFDSLPPEIVGAAGMGIVGTFLFGRKAGMILALFDYTQAKLNQFKAANPEIFPENAQKPIVYRAKIPVEKPASLEPSPIPGAAAAATPTAKDNSAAVARLQGELDRMKAANQTMLAQLQDSYKAGAISLEEYFQTRRDILNQEYAKEADVLRRIGDLEGKPEAQERRKTQLYQLEQKHQQELLKLKQEYAKDAADMADAQAKSDIARNKAASETELAQLKIAHDSDQMSTAEYIAKRKSMLENAFALETASIQKEIEAENEIRKRISLEDKLFETQEKHTRDVLAINQELIDDQKKTALEKSQAMQNIYQSLGTSSEGYFPSQIGILNEQYERYKKLKIDQNVLDQWYANEYKKIYKQQVLASDDFFAGVKQGYQDMIDNQAKLGQLGYTLFDDTLSAAKSTLSSFFDDAWNGKLKSAYSYFHSFAQSILKAWADMLAQMIAKWAMTQAMSGFSSLFGGLFGSALGGGAAAGATAAGSGVINASGVAFGFADGGIIPGISPHSMADNIPIMATAGEWMQPVASVQYYGAQVMEALRQRIIPRELFAGLRLPSYRPAFSYALAAGGAVPASASAGASGLTVINVTDPRDIDRYLSSADGQNAILNVLSSRAPAVKRVLQ